MITAEVIKNLQAPEIHYHHGELHQVASKVLPPEVCDADSLVFVSKPEQLQQALTAHAPIIIAHKNITLPKDSSTAFFSTSSIQLAMSVVLPLFDGKMNRFVQTEKIHPQAFIHPTAHIGKNVTIAPFVFIGEQVRIGDSCTIGANTVIESFATVGDHTLLHPAVFIGAHCHIGSHCEIHSHTTVGSDGFSFAVGANGEPRKIPQIGNVIIEDHVEIGANCAIDRAALTSTRIGRGTKMDNLCHIAHNVQIGQNCLFAGGFMAAGSAQIGNSVMSGGVVAIRDHVKVTDRVSIAGRSGIMTDITEPGAYGGYPQEGFRDHLRTMANIVYLTKMRKQLVKIMKHLNLSEEE